MFKLIAWPAAATVIALSSPASAAEYKRLNDRYDISGGESYRFGVEHETYVALNWEGTPTCYGSEIDCDSLDLPSSGTGYGYLLLSYDVIIDHGDIDIDNIGYAGFYSDTGEFFNRDELVELFLFGGKKSWGGFSTDLFGIAGTGSDIEQYSQIYGNSVTLSIEQTDQDPTTFSFEELFDIEVSALTYRVLGSGPIDFSSDA